MSDEPLTILSSRSSSSVGPEIPDSPRPGKRIILIGGLIIGLVVLAAAGFFVYKKYFSSENQETNQPAVVGENSSTTVATLPGLNQPETATTTAANAALSQLAIEYLSFADFYVSPDNKITAQPQNYKLPLNVKLDILNYYDLSRKLNLDPGLDNLNNNGFALIDNPWSKEAPDFYTLYEKLDEKQIPVLITADFIAYYYQNTLKKVFKDIEENVFYDNLWSINKELYNAAKNRYEAHLATIGNINNSILEGERLEAAYFAVALELLKPTATQTVVTGALDDKSKFTAAEANRFYFITPPYLRDDVSREVSLIRAAKEKIKSPILLYTRDYQDFNVPSDYRANAKLNNFYLTTKWLNSVFPLNYRDKTCASCLLDKEDWRISLIAASLISHDAANLPEIKNKWARIYKVISFFKGLREDLNYVHYRDSLVALFGPNYEITELFADQNKDSLNNLEKLRAKLLTYDFPALQGAYDKQDATYKNRLGFKMLAENYWPNEYIFGHLTTPAVDKYLGTAPARDNITSCVIKNVIRRCNGLALDTINLVSPLKNNPYFAENTNYLNYADEAGRLKEQLDKSPVWHLTNYWTTLSLIKAMLETNKNNWPVFAQSEAWRQKSLATAAGAWINLQLPLEKFSVNKLFTGQGLSSFSRSDENSYIEPNLELVNELLANNEMLLKMFAALKLDEEVSPALQNLQASSNSLNSLKKVVLKELAGEELSAADNETISDFTKQLKIEPVAIKDRQLLIKAGIQKTGLKEDLNRFKLLVLIHGDDLDKVFAVGPVWDYQEGR
jgi:hypothetical protein